MSSSPPEDIKSTVSKYIGNLPSSGRIDKLKDPGISPPPGIVEKRIFKGLEPKSNVYIFFYGESAWSLDNYFKVVLFPKDYEK